MTSSTISSHLELIITTPRPTRQLHRHALPQDIPVRSTTRDQVRHVLVVFCVSSLRSPGERSFRCDSESTPVSEIQIDREDLELLECYARDFDLDVKRF